MTHQTDTQEGAGYTRIPNELLEAVFRADFTATELEIILFIARYTYGFNRVSYKISAKFIADGINRNIRGVKECLKKLTESKIVLVMGYKAGTTSELALNQNHEKWQCTSGAVQTTSVADYTSVAETTAPVYCATPQLVYCATPNKRNINKNINKNNIYEQNFANLWSLYPRKRGKSAVTAKAKKELYEAGFEKVSFAIEAYKHEIDGKDEQYILHGSTFFNGRWRDYIQEQTSITVDSTDATFERFKNLSQDIFDEYRRLEIIGADGSIDYSLLNAERMNVLQEAGVL